MILSGLTNGYSSYTATPEEYDACHYEGSFTLFGRRQGALYRDVGRGGREGAADGHRLRGRPRACLPGRRRAAATPSRSRRRTRAPRSSSPRRAWCATAARTFSWNGGHPAIDAPPDRRLVTTQRQGRKGRWKRVTTDDGFYDILERDPETDVWTTTFQTTECMRAGKYRFLVTGRADKGSGPEDYRIESDPFALTPIRNIAPTLTVTGRRARVTALYPDPGKETTLLALPRRVRSGVAVLGVEEGRPRGDSACARS